MATDPIPIAPEIKESPRVVVDVGGELALVVGGVIEKEHAELTDVALALGIPRCALGTAQDRKQDTDQQRNDADDDEQFDQGEAIATSFSVFGHNNSPFTRLATRQRILCKATGQQMEAN
jgi:hypothetical protein